VVFHLSMIFRSYIRLYSNGE